MDGLLLKMIEYETTHTYVSLQQVCFTAIMPTQLACSSLHA